MLIANDGNNWLKVSPMFTNHAGQPITPVDQLWNLLDGAYPNLWRAAFKSEDAIKNWRISWSDGFAQEKMTMREVREGIHNCRKKHDMPPSLTQFLKACRPDDSLDSEGMMHLAIRLMLERRTGGQQANRWPSKRMYWAAAILGKDLLSIEPKFLKSRWVAAYTAAIIYSDRDIPDRERGSDLALPPPAKTPEEHAAYAARITALGMLIKPVDVEANWRGINVNPELVPNSTIKAAYKSMQRLRVTFSSQFTSRCISIGLINPENKQDLVQ